MPRLRAAPGPRGLLPCAIGRDPSDQAQRSLQAFRPPRAGAPAGPSSKSWRSGSFLPRLRLGCRAASALPASPRCSVPFGVSLLPFAVPAWPTTSVAPLEGLGPSRIFLFGAVSSRAADDFGRAASMLAPAFQILVWGGKFSRGPQTLVAPTSRTGFPSPAAGDFAGVTSARRRRALKLPAV